MIYDVNADIYNRWTPIRVRKDKDTPNSYKTAIDIWKSYYMPVTLDIIKGNTNIPINANPIERIMDSFLMRCVEPVPLESSGRVYLKIIPGNIPSIAKNCNDK